MPASSVGEEISHLMRDKGYKHSRAVAASLSMKRRGAFRKRTRKRKGVRK